VRIYAQAVAIALIGLSCTGSQKPCGDTLGRRTSQVEVFVGEQELFVSFKEFPWFKDASIRQISNVELPSAHHLYWPDLDIDLAVDSLTHPERYPLISRAQPNKRSQPAPARQRVVKKRVSRSRLRG